ncbi:MAG TPA: marine proteobacterial sortase target protein [Nitrospinota bacterium]|nr:marine proteobacterial sortase target protein [Nitrospinota bacterium]
MFTILLLSPTATEAMLSPSQSDTCGTGCISLINQTGQRIEAPALKTDIHISVAGLLLRATIRQSFVNESDEWMEGKYIFPLPSEAAVDHMRLQVGPRIVEGVIAEKKVATAIYKQAKKSGRKTGLVTQQRPNIFTTSVANIPPGEKITIELEYQTQISVNSGVHSFRLPLVVPPRYVPSMTENNTKKVADLGGLDPEFVIDSAINPRVLKSEETKTNPVKLVVSLKPGFVVSRITSKYHPINVSSVNGSNTYLVDLTRGSIKANRDFSLEWMAQRSALPVATTYFEKKDEAFHSMIMVTPPHMDFKHEQSPREVIFVLDVSGSMYGMSFDQAKGALKLALERLTAKDTFNVIAFNDTPRGMFGHPKAASKNNLKVASLFVDSLVAEGGTEAMPAIRFALAQRGKSREKLSQIIFLTDGAVGNEAAIYKTIKEKIGDSRMFMIGIGSAPNGAFMKKAARQGKGTFTFIGKVGEVKKQMITLFKKLESVVLRDIRLSFPESFDVPPFLTPIKDLYYGEPLLLAVKSKEKLKTLNIKGSIGSKEWSKTLTAFDAQQATGVAVYWARTKIAALMDDYRLTHIQETKDHLRKNIIDIATSYHIISPFTSMVAVEKTPSRPMFKQLVSRPIKVHLPQGWNYTKVFGASQGATSGPMNLFIGFLFMLLAIIMSIATRVWKGA